MLCPSRLQQVHLLCVQTFHALIDDIKLCRVANHRKYWIPAQRIDHLSSSWDKRTPASSPMKPPIIVWKAGDSREKISALSTSLAHNPSKNAVTIPSTAIQRVKATITVTVKVSLLFRSVEFMD